MKSNLLKKEFRNKTQLGAQKNKTKQNKKNPKTPL
jgi:hypothetical protein